MVGDELSGIFARYGDLDADLTACLTEVRSALQAACLPGGECDPREPAKAMAACNAYGQASRTFLRVQLSFAAVELLQRAWNEFSGIQREENIPVYRAGLSAYLANWYVQLGDKGAAVRWALLTQAADLIDGHSEGGGVGRQLLTLSLGMSERGLRDLAEIGRQARSAALARGWQGAWAFREDVVMRFAASHAEQSYLFTAPTAETEFPLNPAYLSALREAAHADLESRTEQGSQLEDLATYLFLLIPGLVPSRNALREDTETDLVVRNLTAIGNVVGELLGRHFIVECKNVKERVGVAHVGYFLYRIRLTHARFGVLFTRRGITGGANEERDARNLIRRAFHEDGTVCVVLDTATIERLGTDYTSFWGLLVEQIELARFGNPRPVGGARDVPPNPRT